MANNPDPQFDKTGFLNRVFKKIPKNGVIELIPTYITDWTPSKKQKRIKKELYDDFMKLENHIGVEHIEEILEFAIMSRTIGYPAYTYKLDVSKIGEIDLSKESVFNNTQSILFKEVYQISIENPVNEDESFNFTLRIKEYNSLKIYDSFDSTSLNGIYKVDIKLDRKSNKLTICAGNENINEVCKEFVKEHIKWPIETYLLEENINQAYQIGNTDFKTAAVLDFVHNRLKVEGFESTFKEIKFFTEPGQSSRSEGIKNITINGDNILSSQLACEYITVGSAIISFKLDIQREDFVFSAIFSLKGKENKQMKIVLIDTDEESEDIMNYMQAQYIEMCKDGLKNLDETLKTLATIREKFNEGDKYVFHSVKNSVLKTSDILLNVLKEYDCDDELVANIYDLAYNNEVLLDSIGYNEGREKLEEIYEIIGYDEEDFEDDFEEDNR